MAVKILIYETKLYSHTTTTAEWDKTTMSPSNLIQLYNVFNYKCDSKNILFIINKW